MTHSLHRRGTHDSLSNYFIILFRIDPAIPEQLVFKGSPAKRANIILETLKDIPLVALEVETLGPRLRYMSGWPKGKQDSGLHKASNIDEIYECKTLTWVRHVILKGKDNLITLLANLKEKDLGISVVVSGVFDEVEDACRAIGRYPHSVNMSLGIWGKTDLLPEEEILQFCTMCGHSIIAPALVRKLIADVRQERISPIEAAVELGKQCTCNIFNVERALRMMAAK